MRDWVIGVSNGLHDSAAALFCDGHLVFMVEQERLSRVKHALNDSPQNAISKCLEFAQIELADVRVVAIGSDHRRLARWVDEPTERGVIERLDDPVRLFGSEMSATRTPPIVAFPHHLAHAASAFFASGFQEAAVLVIDAMGEDTAGAIAFGSGRALTVVRSLDIEGSIGFFFETACEYAGLDALDAGKLMGLAAYGNPRFPMPLSYGDGVLAWRGLPPTTATGRAGVVARNAELLRHFTRTCFPYEAGVSGEPMVYADFAASVQAALDRTIVSLARDAQRFTGARNVALAGGVALNCTANGRLAAAEIYDGMFVQPVAADAGVALGAGYLASCDVVPPEEMAPMGHAYWGAPINEDEAVRAITRLGFQYARLDEDELVADIAERIASGEIVAWVQGRAEIGPRALGSRSLLADPRSRRVVQRVNAVKCREVWRPLAPSIIEERFGDFFVGRPSPFMNVASMVREDRQHLVPGVVHVDGSARPQAVSYATNAPYWKLIKRFEAVSGIPIILNTSLNGPDEPIVYSATDAVEMVARNPAIDALALGPYVVTRV